MKQLIIFLSPLYCTFLARGQSSTPPAIPAITVNASTKLCSCEIVKMNHDNKNQALGIFAEKILKGKAEKNYKLMDDYIRREKYHLNKGFVDKIKVVGSFKSRTDCMTLYRHLRLQNNFKMYQILNVDVLESLVDK